MEAVRRKTSRKQKVNARIVVRTKKGMVEESKAAGGTARDAIKEARVAGGFAVKLLE